MRALVVLPTYNEAENVLPLSADVLAQDAQLDVLVVDDNSPDGTGDLVEAAQRHEPRIYLLRRPGKLGLGTAYLDGFRWGLERGYDWLFEMDADFSHDPAHLPQFIESLTDHDVVLGSRYLEGRVTVVNWPMGRLLLSYYANVYARFVTGVPVADLTSGFKAFRAPVLRAIPLERVESEGYAFQIEMSFRAWKRSFRICEIPIVFVDRTLGESKMSKGIIWEAVFKVWKLRLQSLFGKF